MARAGSTIDLTWTDWFGNHKGPVLTYMGLLPNEATTLQDVGFFKIDEAGYDPKTMTYGSDWLIKNNNTQTVTIPSDIKPGTYVVRHEIIALHNSWQEDKIKQTSGAQHYPNCFKVEVTGSGTATPPSQKFPGTYHWNDPGILVNIYYGPNEYVRFFQSPYASTINIDQFTPGGPLYKGTSDGPNGPAPIVKETGALSGEVAVRYQAERTARNRGLMSAVHQTAAMPGGGGCHWELGADPSTMKCVQTNKGDPTEQLWLGFAQPVGSPLYVEKPGLYMRRAPPPKFFETYNASKTAVKFRG